MPDYGSMYRRLFNVQSDAIQVLEDITEKLKKTQQDTEQMYIDAPDTDIHIIDPGKNDGDG